MPKFERIEKIVTEQLTSRFGVFCHVPSAGNLSELEQAMHVYQAVSHLVADYPVIVGDLPEAAWVGAIYRHIKP